MARIQTIQATQQSRERSRNCAHLALTALAIPCAIVAGSVVATPFAVVYEMTPKWGDIDIWRMPVLVFWAATFVSLLIFIPLWYSLGIRMEVGIQTDAKRGPD